MSHTFKVVHLDTFRTTKIKLGLDHYQVRSATSLDRFWTVLAFACTFLLYHSEGSDILHYSGKRCDATIIIFKRNGSICVLIF
ncbi:hypothetical protein J41TS12_44190 [Paenibacillus antibioticophila]|uniref:Uncharacterized protein n=1 Tax=Paenibacillus antibioticophila TaxID=1274374 RepID=A0A919XZQ7_9BACL|nr:hypothetical protein J41TS12_44190 [Paenibacillus antibioticophila]